MATADDKRAILPAITVTPTGPGLQFRAVNSSLVPFRSKTFMPKVSSKSEPFCIRANCSSDRSSTLGTVMTSRPGSRLQRISLIRWLCERSSASATRRMAASFDNDHAALAIEQRVAGMRRLRRSPAMVAGHQPDQSHVFAAEPEDLAVINNVERMFVVAGTRR